MLDKYIRENVYQYNLKHRNDKGVQRDKDRTQIICRLATLLDNNTNRAVHEEDMEDKWYDYKVTVDPD